MKNTFRLVPYIRFFLIVFCSWVIMTPLHAQWVKIISNPHRTISDSSRTIQIKTTFKNFKRASTDSSGVLKDIKVARNPEQVIITNDNKFAFVRDFLSNTVELIDIAKGEIIKSFLIPSPIYLSLSNDGAKLFVASLTDSLQDPSLSPDDCQMTTIAYPTGKSLLTIIDIAKQEIEKTYIIETNDLLRGILNSSNNDIIYLTSDFEIIEVNIKDLIINKRWQFSKQLLYAEIDKKNKRIFWTSFSDTLKALDLSNGAILSAPLYTDGTSALCSYIAIDTLSNRIFLEGNFVGPGSDVLVFNAISLSQYTPIKSDFALQSIVILPNLNTLYIGGFGGKTLELDYLTLNTRKILQTSYNWHSMLYNNKNNKLYAFQYGGIQGSATYWVPSTYLDLIEYNINNDELFQYNTTESKYGCSFGRTIAITSDGNIVIITNSPENTISILYLNSHALSVSQTKKSTGEGISVYPNPTSYVLRISINNKFDTDYKVELFNDLGVLLQTLMKRRSETSFDLNLSGFPTGIYMLRIYSTDRYFQTKVIKR